ncbi:MAG: hypothetical protein ACOYVF_01175 [Candidatus Zixiibacteriota bacterium]
MKLTGKIISVAALMFLFPLAAFAQVDSLGKLDTLYADVAKIDDANWTVTFSYINDESVIALSLPFKITAGLNRIVADSIVYAAGKVDSFAYKGFRVDTAIQCITLGLIANLGPTKNKLAPGSGPFATVYISSLEQKPIEKLKIDTTTTSPNNSLMIVADQLQGVPPDTVRVPMSQTTIIPAFLVREPKK